MQRQSEQVQVRDTCVISTAENGQKTTETRAEREREGEKSSRSRGRARPLDGQLSWQLPDWGVPAYTKSVCAKVRNKWLPLPSCLSLPLSVSLSLSFSRSLVVSATEAIIIALIVSCVCVLCFILSGPELHKGVSPEKCPPLELRVSTLAISLSHSTPLCPT